MLNWRNLGYAGGLALALWALIALAVYLIVKH